MVDKSFEHTIPFHPVPASAGQIWLPIVTVNLVQPTGNRVQLPLIFDTGADVTTLRHDLYSFLGLSSWNMGHPVKVNTAGGAAPVTVYRYQATLEFLGKAVTCPIHLAELPHNPLYLGLFGRDQIFREFGFAFWEKDHHLYVTEAP